MTLDTKALLPPKPYTLFNTNDEIEKSVLKELSEDQDFINASCFREQVGITCKHLRTEQCMISYRRIASIFNVNVGTIKDQESKYINGVFPDGRPPSFTDDELNMIFQYIDSNVDDKTITYDDLSDYVFCSLKKDISKESLRHIINRNFQEHFKSVIGVPMDSKRIEVEPELIDKYYSDLEKNISTVHPYFIFNLDEVGVQDFQDAPQQYVIVRRNYDHPTAPYSVERNGKRITALACITTNADWIPPLIITNRTTHDSELYSFIPSDKFMIASQAKGFLTTINLKKWFEQVFLPMLEQKRQRFNYHGPCLLLMDGFISHEQILDIIPLDQYGIIVQFIVAHASDQLQMLDLGIFGNQKRQISGMKNEKSLSSQTNRICKIIDGLWKASSPKNVVSAFRSAGVFLTCKMNNNVPMIYAGVRRGAARAVRHYNESFLESLINANLPISPSQTLARNKLTLQEIHENSFRIKI